MNASEWARQPLREQLLAAAVRQGPSFLVLVLLLVGLGQLTHYVVTVGVPAHLAEIRAGYLEVQKHHDQNLERVIAGFAEEQERYHSILQMLERLVDNRALLLEHRELLANLLAELESRDHSTTKEPVSP